MAEFDIDSYLEKKDKKQGFDIDSYLEKTKPETALQTFGRSAASIPDTALNLVTGALDIAAYPLARAYYGMTGNRTPEEAAALAQQQTTSPKDVIGRALGVAGTPGYENAPQRQLGNYIGQTLGENVVQPLAQTTGLPEQDISSMVNIGSMAVPGMTKGAVQAVKPVVAPIAEFGKGAAGVASGTTARPGVTPKVWQQGSARIPATETYLPAEAQSQWRQGEISTREAQQAMVPYTPEQQQLLSRTKGNVPVEGQVARAAGEQFMDPLTSFKGWIPELAGAAAGGLIGGPIGAAIGAGGALAGKAYSAVQNARQIGAMKQLGGLGFTPQTAAEAAALKSGAPHPVAGPVAPQTPAQQMANAGSMLKPVAPLQLPYDKNVPRGSFNQVPVYVGPEGMAGTNLGQVGQAGLQQKYAPQSVSQTPKEMSMAAAASKIQSMPLSEQIMAQGGQGADILAQIRARNAAGKTPLQPKGPFTPPPEPEGGIPVVNNPPPTPQGGGSLFGGLPEARWSPEEKLALERANLQKNPPPPTTMSAAEEAKAQMEMSKQSNLTDWGRKTTADKENARGILSQYFDEGGKGTSIYSEMIDLDDKVALKETGGSKLVRSAKLIQQKAGVDSIPSIPGFRDTEVINMAADMLKDSPKKAATYTPSENKPTTSLQEALNKVRQSNNPDVLEMKTGNVETLQNPGKFKPDPEVSILTKQVNSDKSMVLTGTKKGEPITIEVANFNNGGGVKMFDKNNILIAEYDKKGNKLAQQTQSPITEVTSTPTTIDEAISAKKSFNQDSEKYRYGSPKNPLTLEEYNHLQNSDYIENQGLFDRLKGINPDFTEHSFWYKDKNGVITNMEAHTGDLRITKIDKNNPEKEISYSKSNPDREDEWVFYKIEHIGGNRKILEKFEVKNTLAPRHPKLKDWPEEFTNSKYDFK